MGNDLVWIAALGVFFLAFGVYNWFSPFIAAIGLDLRVDPQELDVVRRTLARLVALGMAAIGLGMLYYSVRVALAS
jgi:hypothetical protein